MEIPHLSDGQLLHLARDSSQRGEMCPAWEHVKNCCDCLPCFLGALCTEAEATRHIVLNLGDQLLVTRQIGERWQVLDVPISAEMSTQLGEYLDDLATLLGKSNELLLADDGTVLGFHN